MTLSKSDWIAVRNSSSYQELVGTLREAIETYGAEMINRTVSNQDRDMYVRGAIQMAITVLEWQPEFDESEDEVEA